MIQGRTRSEHELRQGSDKDKETWGGMMVRSVWNFQVDNIIYVKIGDADADTYNHDPMTVLLDRREIIKKDKQGKYCHDQRKLFSPFVLSVDRMLGR